MTPADIIAEARYILNDIDSVYYRQEDAELLLYVNDAIREASRLAPELFFDVKDYTCIDGSEQALSFTDSQALVGVIRIKNGAAVHLCDMTALSQFNPDWGTVTAGASVNWMKTTGDDPLTFYVYPKATAGQVLEVKHVKVPTVYALNDPITELPDSSRTALANYVCSRTETKDDEHVDTGRAVALYNLFAGYFKPQQPQEGA